MKDITSWRNNRRTILGMLSFGHGIAHWFDNSFPVLLPSITASLGLSNLQVGSIGTAKEIDVNTLAAHLQRIIPGRPGRAEHGSAKRGEQRRSVLAWDRAARILGWSPTTPLDEGLKRTVAFFRQ